MVKTTELMEKVGDTHGMRPRRKGGSVDWLIRVRCKLEYYDRRLLAYAGVVTLLEKPEWPNAGWNCRMAWVGGCGPKKTSGASRRQPLKCG